MSSDDFADTIIFRFRFRQNPCWIVGQVHANFAFLTMDVWWCDGQVKLA